MARVFATLAVVSALLISMGSPVAEAANRIADNQPIRAAQSKQATKWVHAPDETAPDKGEPHRYIVEFEDEPLPLYRGGISGLAPVNTGAGKRMNPRSPAARAYVDHLRQEQTDMLTHMRAKAGDIRVLRTHQHALNAATVVMTEAAANKVRSLPGVRLVERDRAVEMKTASTPAFIGADQLWNGTATGVPYQGEGEVIGIIDGGINPVHPSFAATGDDGYTVVNPLGSGNYLGECNAYPGTCNDKLIGAYTFLAAQPSNPPDEILLPGAAPFTDTNGHGSHTASTAAGNVLYNVPLPDADGNPSSIVFPRISGVAPHANIVVYKVCAPSCYFSDIVAAVDQAIADGVVDVINHSIGTPSGSPWNSTQAQAFLAARAAGIFVSNSAGNDGPDAGTAEVAGNAPWVAGVGGIFASANVLAGISALLAVPLAKKFGLINTMVFTHIPSNILLILIPFMPSLPLAIGLLLLRFSISQMDVPTRQSYTMAVVAPDERSAASGVTAIARSVGASVSPMIAGLFFGNPVAWLSSVPIIACGGLKIAYDLLLFREFRAVKPPEES